MEILKNSLGSKELRAHVSWKGLFGVKLSITLSITRDRTIAQDRTDDQSRAIAQGGALAHGRTVALGGHCPRWGCSSG